MYLLDANVVSELRKIRLGKANERVGEWADSIDAADLYLSVITIQELEIGVLLAERHGTGNQSQRGEDWWNMPVQAGRSRSIPVCR